MVAAAYGAGVGGNYPAAILLAGRRLVGPRATPRAR